MSVPHGASPDAADEWIASWTQSVSEQAAHAHELAQRVAALTVSASGAGGAVVVTVAGSGVVTDLRLGDRARTWSADDLAQEILRVMRRAQGNLADEVARVVRETVGSDTETGKAVVAGLRTRFPPQPDEPPARSGRRSARR